MQTAAFSNRRTASRRGGFFYPDEALGFAEKARKV
jgi:hypothetical protein